MNTPQIRLDILHMAMDIAQSQSWDGKDEHAPHVEDILEIADSLADFVFAEDDDFSDIVDDMNPAIHSAFDEPELV